jgi:hypothetical protein
LAAVATSRAAARNSSSQTIDFSRDIRPILSDNCFKCHGPDEKERKAKLRFDVKEDAFKPAKSGEYAIVPDDLAKSKLIERITSKDEDEVMPPPKSKKKLTLQQIDLLKRWVSEGARWDEHWAFVPPKRPELPRVKKKSWPQNEIDYFVLARLEKEGLDPSPEADKKTLARRASFDLTGLPPTPQEVDAFLADKSPGAYDKLVNRLLNSPRYGENMARYWLDAARYADSHGYHIDSERSMWKWRDWVVQAFNNNMPFDEFTLEQLAGDLLPDATTDQKIGSGYVRCNMTTGEGGAIEAEYQSKYTFDRVETTSTIWLGLTMTCARCHTHKYDPIAQREYYGIYALFNNLNEPVMDGNKPNPDPFIKLPTPEQSSRQAWLKQHIDDGQKKIDAPMPDLDQAQSEWASKWHYKLSTGWTVLAPASVKSAVTNGAELRLLEDKSVLAEGPNPEQDVHEVTLKLEPGSIAAIRLETLPDESFAKKSSARADDGKFRLSEFEAEIGAPADEDAKKEDAKDDEAKKADGKKEDAKKEEANEPKPKKLKFTQAVADSSEAKFEIDKAIDGKADTGWGVPESAVAEPHTALFVLGEATKISTNSELRVRLKYEASKSKRAIGRFRLAAAQNEELVRLLNPPKPEPWQVVGPFKSEDLKTGFATEYEPEKEIDLKKKYPGVREEIKWAAKTDFDDGKANVLVQYLHGVNGVYYLYRKLKAPAACQAEFAFRADDLFKVWVNDKLVLEQATKQKAEDGPAKVAVGLNEGENKILVKVVNYHGPCYFTFNKDMGQAEGLEGLPGDIAAVLATTKNPTTNQLTKVRNYYRRQNSSEFKQMFDEVRERRDENDALDRTIPTTMVAKEVEQPRETFMLMRGEYDKKGDKVEAGVPAILPPLPKDAPTNRLGFAKWLVEPSHPLTARVTVNRFWQQYFGVGFVKTAEDFGVQGERPSHPDLLDWLATEFMRTGWDVKELQRLIVTSATYRQSSRMRPELLAKDPENRLLARGPRFRLDGEVLRDTALYVSGLLIDKPGGHSVKPFEPPGLWEAVSFNNSQKYIPDKGEGQYRRSLYTYWKRQSPPPNMLIFDAPTREYCVVRRPRTNTPLQALVLMNDPQFVEAARAFAQRMMTEVSGDAKKRITYAVRLATGRTPGADEIKVLLDVYHKQLAEFRTNAEEAEKFLNVGSFKANADLDKDELAAWTTIASMILNLDETVTKG